MTLPLAPAVLSTLPEGSKRTSANPVAASMGMMLRMVLGGMGLTSGVVYRASTATSAGRATGLMPTAGRAERTMRQSDAEVMFGVLFSDTCHPVPLAVGGPVIKCIAC